MKDVSAIIVLLDASEDGNSMENEGRLSYNQIINTPLGMGVPKNDLPLKGVLRGSKIYRYRARI